MKACGTDMKIKYIKGDLFQTEVSTIVHGCNAQGVMGSGVAKIVRERYYKAYKRYLAYYQSGLMEVGDCIAVTTNGKTIINAVTQEYYGRDGNRYVSYDAVAEVMKVINRSKIEEVAMPMIGAGLGGGDWNVIEAIIQSELKNVQPYVYFLE